MLLGQSRRKKFLPCPDVWITLLRLLVMQVHSCIYFLSLKFVLKYILIKYLFFFLQKMRQTCYGLFLYLISCLLQTLYAMIPLMTSQLDQSQQRSCRTSEQCLEAELYPSSITGTSFFKFERSCVQRLNGRAELERSVIFSSWALLHQETTRVSKGFSVGRTEP